MRLFRVARLALAALSLLVVTREARADEPRNPTPTGEEADEAHPRRVFSLTISPIHLLLPVLELTGEARATDKLGFAFVAGAGKITDSVNGTKVTAGVTEIGAQVRYYVLGDFRHGMQLGAELLYLHVSSSEFSATGEGLAIGPFAGYKIITDVGFTFDAQLGAEYVGARGKSNNGASQSSDHSVIPLININIGWSF